MIKIIKKFFTSPDKIEDSKVELIVDIPEETRVKLFDEAVKQVVKQKLYDLIEVQLCEMCYTEAQIKSTKQALEFNDGKSFIPYESFHGIVGKFPDARLVRSSTDYYKISLDFNLNKFILKIMDGVV